MIGVIGNYTPVNINMFFINYGIINLLILIKNLCAN